MIEPYYDRDGITIYRGDALQVLPELDEATFGAVVTDPPYSSGGAFRGDRVNSTVSKYVQTGTAAYRAEFAGDSRDQRGFLAWCSLWLAAARAASTSGAVLAAFTDWRQLPVLVDAVQAGGWVWRGLATWHKPGIRMQRGAFSHSAEYLVHGTNGRASRDYDGAQQNVFACPPAKAAGKIHIAEKPVRVMDWILRVCPPDGIILDPFMGSGTTLVAARGLGRRAVGIEIDPECCRRPWSGSRAFKQACRPVRPGLSCSSREGWNYEFPVVPGRSVGPRLARWAGLHWCCGF